MKLFQQFKPKHRLRMSAGMHITILTPSSKLLKRDQCQLKSNFNEKLTFEYKTLGIDRGSRK